MKKLIQIIVVVSSFALLSGCKKGFLDKTPDGDLTLDQIFTNSGFTEQFLTNIYSQLPQELRMVDNPGSGLPNNPFNGASDDMEMSYSGNFATEMNLGNWNPVTYTLDFWSNCYYAIRKANLFLENIDKLVPSDLAPVTKINRWKGEAIFLRAFYHFLLIRVYGPVPVLDRTYNLNEDFSTVRRQPIDQCVNFIVAECDKAAALLEPKVSSPSDYGRPSKAAALALKARTLLYMASPLWNGNPDYAGFKDKEGTPLFPDFDGGRWQVAADAAKKCIDEASAAGYTLYRSGNNNPVKNYQELFYTNFNSEVFFTGNDPDYQNIDAYSEPRGMTGANWPLQSPTQDLVDDFEMANGTRPITGYNADMTPIINPLSGYTENGQAAVETDYYYAGTRTMYVNREPRFYATINFTGAKYKTGDPQNRKTPLQFWKLGLDGRTNVSTDFYSKTGYLLKKLTHPAFVMSPKSDPKRTWIFFRLGEQYLNYAEALNEAQGPLADVYKYVNLIRDRSGLPGLTAGLSKETMREAIRHERRIELAFETHRYFDCHRWKIAEVTDNKNIYGLNVDGVIKEATEKDPAVPYTITSDAFYKRTLIEKRIFDKKHYLWPIQQRDIDKNPNLVQNPFW